MADENTGVAPVENAAPIESDQSLEAGGLETGAAVADAQAVVADPNATKAEKAEAKKTLKSLKIKYNNKEYEEQLPFEIPDTDEAKNFMLKHLQMSKMGHSKAQEKSDIENEVREFLEELRNDPESILTNPHIGIDMKKLATQIIEREIENEKKSPAELELEKAKKELKAIKAAQEKENEARKAREMERIQEEAFERYGMLMDEAFAKNPSVPKTGHFIKRVSDYVLLGLQNGLDVSPLDVIGIVQDEYRDELKANYAASPDEVIEELLGKERLSAMQKKRLAKAKAAQAAAPAPKVQDTGNKGAKPAEPAKKVTIKDFFKV